MPIAEDPISEPAYGRRPADGHSAGVLGLRGRAVETAGVNSMSRSGTPRLLGALVIALLLTASLFAAPAAASDLSRPKDPRFTIAVIPDTQQEVLSGNDRRFAQRTAWLVSHRRALDLRFVAHTGDIVNWGWLARWQYVMASRAMGLLQAAGIPYAVAPGNHDTRAVGWNGHGGYGGGPYVANPECDRRLGAAACHTNLLVRHTEEFDSTFNYHRYRRVSGAFERGKVDNIFSTFRAGGRKWMVLTLELWPRVSVVNWARRVVATHPHFNVIISTHSYLDARSQISGNAEYGQSSGRYLFAHLVSVYRNIKVVLSGHVGVAGSRVDVGRHGNRIASFLGTFHSNTTNPVRLLVVQPRLGRITARFAAPKNGQTFPQYNVTVRKLHFVR
jgi:hypothetical protein